MAAAIPLIAEGVLGAGEAGAAGAGVAEAGAGAEAAEGAAGAGEGRVAGQMPKYWNMLQEQQQTGASGGFSLNPLDWVSGISNAINEKKQVAMQQDAEQKDEAREDKQEAHDEQIQDKDAARADAQQQQDAKTQDAQQALDAKTEQDQTNTQNRQDDRADKELADKEKSQQIVIDQETKANGRVDQDQSRQDNNDFNIKSNFLANVGDALQKMTMGQYNILIRTDQEKDADKSRPTGTIGPLDLVKVELSSGSEVNYQVQLMDAYMFVRAGSIDNASLWWWPPEAKRDHFDAQNGLPAGTHFEFDVQKKLPWQNLPRLEDLLAAQKKPAARNSQTGSNAKMSKSAETSAKTAKASTGAGPNRVPKNITSQIGKTGALEGDEDEDGHGSGADDGHESQEEMNGPKADRKSKTSKASAKGPAKGKQTQASDESEPESDEDAASDDEEGSQASEPETDEEDEASGQESDAEDSQAEASEPEGSEEESDEE